MRQFWVVGGVYRDSQFLEIAEGAQEVREGPFETYDLANKAWQALAWASVDDALAQFHIEEEDLTPDQLVPTYWVMGGTYSGDGFERFESAPERYGPYESYDMAKAKWSELAWASVDDASARYRIETLHPKAQAVVEPKLAYRLLTGADDAAFCKRVSEALSDGYALHGSPGISQGPEGVIVCQAVVLQTIALKEEIKP